MLKAEPEQVDNEEERNEEVENEIKNHRQSYLDEEKTICLFACMCPYLTAFYLMFIAWRYISVIFYATYATECFFKAKLATLRCDDSGVFPYPTKFEVAWQMSSAVNSLISISIVAKLSPFPGFRVIWKKLVRYARFWSLSFQLIVVITYNIILILHEHLTISFVIEVGFIIDEVTVTLVVCLWNFIPAPNKDTATSSFQCCYYVTLIAYFLENLYLFVLMSSQAALDITGIHEFEHRPASLQAVSIVMNATEATFYFAIMKFFWNKMFEPDRDLFEKETI
ncbi:uncharacterized protein LOC116293754 [Actinia tenebrosa]|uniref:Uncharacterized protein LOC116293754 n=1 Tax=Actinia tenebrosa TaxID=6105 RepID=A0A6P8HPR5_ACTTE|nr:uncharacterized protein LOC116293754 [Actinia tenebrosa]